MGVPSTRGRSGLSRRGGKVSLQGALRGPPVGEDSSACGRGMQEKNGGRRTTPDFAAGFGCFQAGRRTLLSSRSHRPPTCPLPGQPVRAQNTECHPRVMPQLRVAGGPPYGGFVVRASARSSALRRPEGRTPNGEALPATPVTEALPPECASPRGARLASAVRRIGTPCRRSLAGGGSGAFGRRKI